MNGPQAPGRPPAPLTRRGLLGRIGKTAGGAAMYQAMTALGFAAESPYRGPPSLQGAPTGSRVLVLGAGIAGLVGAIELQRAGHAVTVLEYNPRAGGRCWTLRGGDSTTELGGATQQVNFDEGLYFNPGPWRIPYHHHGVLDYARRYGVALEPFVQVNYNAWLHSRHAYGGKPQRFRHVQADFHGHVAELLGKAVGAQRLDDALTAEDRDRLLEALHHWGALDNRGRYSAGRASSRDRGFEVPPGGGLMPAPLPSTPLDLPGLLASGLWHPLVIGHEHDYQTTLFQPVGGMDRIAMALYREVAPRVQFGAKVTAIAQDESGVTVSYVDASGATRQARAEACLCTLPLSILSQIETQVSAPMQAAIDAVPYEAAVKVGLQFKRRFWEEDERIYGGITHTDLPIQSIGYPASDFGAPGKGVLLGAYAWGPNAYELTARSPQERVALALRYGRQIHPQYDREFDGGVAVGWHRVPWALGCFGLWTDEARKAHYRDLCQVDGRVVLAGEHASMIPAWQEGALLSALDAVTRLHARLMAGR